MRSRQEVLDLVRSLRLDAVIHTAAQPSHDLAARRPFDDFDVNACGTLNLLDGMRRQGSQVAYACSDLRGLRVCSQWADGGASGQRALDGTHDHGLDNLSRIGKLA